MTASFSGRLVNGWTFARRLLCQGRDPLADPAELATFVGQLKGLLGTEPIAVDMTEFLLDQISGTPDIEAIEKALDSAEIQVVLQALGNVGQTVGVELCLVLAGPAAFARLVACPGDEDALDDLSIALTGLVRTASGAGIAGILLEEDSEDSLDFLGPVFNVAEHNQVGIGIAFKEANPSAVPASLRHAYGEGLESLYLHGENWVDAARIARGSTAYIKLPADADPDQVQSVLAK